MKEPIRIEREGQRIYFGGDTYAARAAIKAMGGHWDGLSKRWWVGAAKLARAEALVAELATPNEKAPRAAEAAGLDPSTPAGIVADKLEEEGRSREAEAVRRGRDLEDPANIRLTGKGQYKGKSYYLGSPTRDGSRVRLLTLPDRDGKFLDFWADVRDVRRTKEYEPREERGAYGRRTGRYQYQTLGSIASFVARQERARADGLPACAACGKRGHLVEDLEDGLWKCVGCADMPA